MFAIVYGDKVEYIPISDSMSVNLNLFLTENKTVRVEVFQKDDIYNYLYLGEVTLNKDSTLTIEEINNSSIGL